MATLLAIVLAFFVVTKQVKDPQETETRVIVGAVIALGGILVDAVLFYFLT